MAAKTPNPIDVHVGGRVRMRRIEVNMSQQILGGHIGLTFQQVQKYEKGTNRIGASRLQQIGRVLEVPTSYFFEGAPGGWEAGGNGGAANTFLELLGTCLVGDAVLIAPVSTQIPCYITGNFTGNVAILRHPETALGQETAAPQRLLREFPMQSTGKIFRRSGNFAAATGNFIWKFVSVHFSHTFPGIRKHDLFSLSICK
jgi:transcriptional regulator with XRE-family HTH domain